MSCPWSRWIKNAPYCACFFSLFVQPIIFPLEKTSRTYKCSSCFAEHEWNHHLLHHEPRLAVRNCGETDSTTGITIGVLHAFTWLLMDDVAMIVGQVQRIVLCVGSREASQGRQACRSKRRHSSANPNACWSKEAEGVERGTARCDKESKGKAFLRFSLLSCCCYQKGSGLDCRRRNQNWGMRRRGWGVRRSRWSKCLEEASASQVNLLQCLQRTTKPLRICQFACGNGYLRQLWTLRRIMCYALLWRSARELYELIARHSEGIEHVIPFKVWDHLML